MLREAIKNEDIHQVRSLLDAGVDVNERTALHVAAATGNLAILRPLLNAGADAKVENRYGETALHHAVCKRRDFHVIKTLVEAGSDVNSRTMTGRTPLHFAARQGDVKVVKNILSKGADVDTAEGRGDTPLGEVAVYNGVIDYPVMKTLLNHGATVTVDGPFLYSLCFSGSMRTV